MSRFRSIVRSLLSVAACLSLASPSLAAAAKAKPRVAAKAPTRAAPKTAAKPVEKITAPKLSVAEIVKRHVAARGGSQAWQAVQALSLSGKMDAGTGDSVARSMRMAQPVSRKGRRDLAAAARPQAPEQQVQLPFTLAEARPNKTRLEIAFAGRTAVQVYDGAQGWKVRPYLNRGDVEPFTADETKVEAESPGLDGLLIGYQAKGSKVALAAIEKVEGRDAYKLEVTTRAGTVRHVWVDAKSFLDVKVEGAPRRLDGKPHDVFVYQRDFRTVQGVKLPFLLETVVDGYPQSHRILFEKVAVNPRLTAATFAKPKA